jgi:hypothetical protein
MVTINTKRIAAGILNERLNRKKYDQPTTELLKVGILYHSGKLKRTDPYGKETSFIAETSGHLACETYRRFGNLFDNQKAAHDIHCGVICIAQCHEIIKKYGIGIKVYRSPSATACEQCKYLYLNEDGTPRLFRPTELLKAGGNHKRKKIPNKILKRNTGKTPETECWQPVAGLTHPWCNCGPVSVFTGMEWWAE